MGSPLRILHVVVNMNRGGAETLLMNLYRNIDRSRIQFDFLTCKEGVFDQEIQRLGGKVHRIPYISDVGHRGYIRELINFFSSHKEYRIVHSHLDKMSGLVLKVAKDHNIPNRIAHSHNTSSEGSMLARLYKWYVGKAILINATHYLACSDKAAQWLFKGQKKNARVLKNGIEPGTFMFSPQWREKVKEEFQLDSSAFVLGHIGRFNKQKNHSYLLDVFAKVAKENKHVYLLLIGDGVIRKEMEKKVHHLGLGKRVIFSGVRSDIPSLLQGIDLFVFPSLHEGLPVTLIEAQCAGLPCLISDTITNEVDLGLDLVKFLPLKMQEKWVKEINLLSTTSKNRSTNSASALTEKGYDIRNTASWVEGFYSAI
ncbi:glycosyltransferase family 1 protein [Sutcliffiella sp. NPDC057660]|uniref:glycosyltransferase family 1 protein n=1 Tax=Sutcliffiella sp. NPDC057660 TaxID=3346199 RepID=UPI003694F029